MAEINLLVLNVGNSRLGIAVFAAGELQPVTRLSHGQRGDWSSAIEEAWSKISTAENAAICGASVNPPLEAPLDQAVQTVTGKRIEWVGRDIDLPMKTLSQNTGVDRVLNLAAAFEQIGKGCVVVDAGTAITIDVCNDKSEFMGGAIAPGAAMMLQSMHEKTARLPLVQLEKPEGSIGKTTEQAMLQGVFHGIRGMVKELVENYATELGYWPDVIVTGGDAEKLFAGWELVHAISPDLLFYGMALAYANHYIKHET